MSCNVAADSKGGEKKEGRKKTLGEKGEREPITPILKSHSSLLCEQRKFGKKKETKKERRKGGGQRLETSECYLLSGRTTAKNGRGKREDERKEGGGLMIHTTK